MKLLQDVKVCNMDAALVSTKFKKHKTNSKLSNENGENVKTVMGLDTLPK